MKHTSLSDESMELSPVVSLPAFAVALLATIVGTFIAILALPLLLPGLSSSLGGNAPHVFWFLSRSSAVVAYLLLWLSVSLGLLITNRVARIWPGGPAGFDLHQHTSLLGIGFALFHGLILMGDHYLHINLLQLAIPFSVAEYRPFWVGLGQLAIYLMSIVTFSFYFRKQITPRIWRMLHYLSFVVFGLAFAHGIASGSDSAAAFPTLMYWSTGGVFIFLFVYRVLTRLTKTKASAYSTFGSPKIL